ncbi:hypothetical protein IH980_04085 [Patescibacteria group bacterium]|nr:hypothetical protein [Patescibacteria group bacterium]
MAAQQEQQTPSQDQEPTPQPSTPEGEKLMKEFPSEKKAATGRTVLVVLGILVAGVATGFLLSRGQGKVGDLKSTERIAQEGLKKGDVFGNPDKETFRDEVEGVLVKGGIDGEGSHRLLRPGGKSQNVYLTSSVVDLDQFVDHEILVWGETFAAQKAGWLMDVGRVEVLELNAEKPFEE